MATIEDILTKTNFPIIDSKVFSSHAAIYSEIPLILHSTLRVELSNRFPSGIYSHQASAIECALNGADVCLATSTASGKSLIFQAVACHLALSDPRALTLAIYPARALVQDQLAKWEQLASKFGIRVGQIDGSIKMK